MAAINTSAFFCSIETLLNDMERLSDCYNLDVIDGIVSRLHCAIDTTNQLMHHSTRDHAKLSSLYQHLLAFLERWHNRISRRNHCRSVSSIVHNRISLDNEKGNVGRPQIFLSGQQIECLRNMGFSWVILGVKTWRGFLCLSQDVHLNYNYVGAK